MTDLRETMRGMADRAPGIGDLAERSISRGRRRRAVLRWAKVTAGTVAVAMVVVGAAVVVTDRREPDYATGEADLPYTLEQGAPAREIDLPEETPGALPAGKVGAVDLAYLPDGTYCRDHPAEPRCAWRLVRADGTSWRLTDVYIPDNLSPALTLSNAVQLAPDGDRLAYVRADGATVVRDLVTGSVVVVGRHQPNQTPGWPLVWSRNGRWLALSGQLPDGKGRGIGITIVDTRTGETRVLNYAGGSWGDGVLGLPDDRAPVPIFSELEKRLLIIDRAGRLVQRVELTLADGRTGAWTSGAISPDGARLVSFPQTFGTDAFSQQDIRLLDLATGRQTTVLGPPPAPAYSWNRVLGWQDDSTFLIGDMTKEGKQIHVRTVYAADTEAHRFRAAVRFVGETTPLSGLRLATARL